MSSTPPLRAKHPETRATAGILFESAAQRRLQDTMNLELVPMVRLANSRAETPPRWHSSHNLLALRKSRQEELKKAIHAYRPAVPNRRIPRCQAARHTKRLLRP